jgi:hypothetical protein
MSRRTTFAIRTCRRFAATEAWACSCGPREGEAQLVAIRLDDGAVVARSQVKLPTLKQNTLSQGPGGDDSAAAVVASVSGE